MRYIPLTAWVLCLISMVMSLVTVQVGSRGNKPIAASIATFNISSLGLADYHDVASPLYSNIRALVPSDITNPPSITQYLGLKDWYTMHYLSSCSGFFEPSASDPSRLTANKINVTCVKQPSGYTFSLGSILQHDINPSVRQLADEAASKVENVNTGPWVGVWYLGISTCGVTLVDILFTFGGTVRNMNWWNFIWSGISFISFSISSGLLTGQVIGIHRSGAPLGDPNPYPSTFLGLTWSSTVLMVLVFCLVQVEWLYEIWTPVGEPITIYWKPKDASWFAIWPKGIRSIRTSRDTNQDV